LILSIIAGFSFCTYSCESNSDNPEPEPQEVKNPVIKKTVLSDAVTSVITMNYYFLPRYSMRADVPLGRSLTIVVNDYNRQGTAGVLYHFWDEHDVYYPTWNYTLRDQETFMEKLTVKHSGTSADRSVGFSGGKYGDARNYITIEYYENGSVTPTKVKNLYLVDP